MKICCNCVHLTSGNQTWLTLWAEVSFSLSAEGTNQIKICWNCVHLTRARPGMSGEAARHNFCAI